MAVSQAFCSLHSIKFPRPLWGALALSAVLTMSGVAGAQSAADKATARDLAAQGIKKLAAGDADGALKSLEKAQALYDAPIHLLYLARAHTKLGHLVEAAEAYRTLARTTLASDAPPVFVKAQEDGRGELAELEPRLAKLTIEVSPEVDGLKVTVDGKPINTAALSVPRATNPGTRVVVAEAPGYLTAQSEVTLSEGAEDTVSLTLQEGEQPPAAQDGEAVDSDAAQGEHAAGDDSDFTTGPMGFILGLRVGGALPVGDMETGVPVTDYLQPGVAGRAELGFRFARYFFAKGYFGLGALSPGGKLNEFAEGLDATVVTKNSAGLTDAGVALGGTTDPRLLGGFGELGFSFLHEYRWSQSFSAPSLDCEIKGKFPGWAMRAGGGMNIPVGKMMALVPAVDVSVGQMQKRIFENTCEDQGEGDVVIEGAADPNFTEGSLNKALHYQIFLGVGADFHFGDGLFR